VRVETVLLSLETAQYAGESHGDLGIEAIAEAARRIESLGFDTASTPEAGHDPFLPLVVAAEHTQRLTLGSNVAIAFPRSPMVTAQLAWDLQRLSDGRFQLGLGSQVKGHNERRYSTPWTGPPGPRLREYVLCLRAIFESFQGGGRPRRFEGDHYQFSLLPPFFSPGPIAHPHIPIYLAAVNPYMARLAGELCEGLRLHPIASFRFAREVVVPALAEGARKAGRPRGGVDLVGAPFLALGAGEEDLEEARRALKQRIAFYASTRTYHSVLELHGWLALGQELHRLSLAGQWKEMPALVSDAMLDEFAIVSTYDDLVPRLRERCDGLFDSVLLDLPPELRRDEDRLREIVRALH